MLQEEHSNKQHGRTASVKRQRCASATSACTPPPQPDASVDYECRPEDLTDDTLMIVGIHGGSITLPEASHVHRAALAHEKMWLLVNPPLCIITPPACPTGWDWPVSALICQDEIARPDGRARLPQLSLVALRHAAAAPLLFILRYHSIMHNLRTHPLRFVLHTFFTRVHHRQRSLLRPR